MEIRDAQILDADVDVQMLDADVDVRTLDADVDVRIDVRVDPATLDPLDADVVDDPPDSRAEGGGASGAGVVSCSGRSPPQANPEG